MARRTPVPPAPTVAVTLRGEVPRRIQEYAAGKIGHVARYSREPVLAAHVVLELAADPARQRPAIAEATLDVNGTPVRAKVAADRMREAIDLLEDRLRRRLVQLEDRVRTRHRRIATAESYEWRHGDLPTDAPG